MIFRVLFVYDALYCEMLKRTAVGISIGAVFCISVYFACSVLRLSIGRQSVQFRAVHRKQSSPLEVLINLLSFLQ
jgi:hypothetical protein